MEANSVAQHDVLVEREYSASELTAAALLGLLSND